MYNKMEICRSRVFSLGRKFLKPVFLVVLIYIVSIYLIVSQYNKVIYRQSISRYEKFTSFQALQYIETSDSTVYMLSAYIIEKRKRKDQNVVSVIGLEDNKNKYSDFTCCFRSNNGETIVEHVRSLEHHVFSYENSPFRRVQYTCPLPMMSKSPKWVSITTAFNKTCNKDAKYYVAVQTPSQGELAVCTTVLYGSLSANLLLEWFEVQRVLGVDKVISYTKNLNDDAMKVLEYYESLGLTDIIHVAGFPTRDKDIRLSDNTDRVWINQEVFALDCHTRMYGYKYVMGIDRDEFVVPNIRKYGFSLKRVLDELIDSSTAGFLIKPNIHITTRKPYNESSSLFIRKYLNGTIPVYDRLKYVHVPSRTHIASPSLHYFNPEDGFKRYVVSPTDVTLHHYRSCQKYFGKLFNSDSTNEEERKLNKYDTAVSTCQTIPQFKQNDIEIIGQNIETRVLKLRHELNITKLLV